MGDALLQGNDTHGRDATPDYGRVFVQDQVGRLDIQVSSSDWQALMSDMQDLAGAPGGAGGNFGGQPAPGGAGGRGVPPAGGGVPPGGNAGGAAESVTACTGLTEGSACRFGAPAVDGRCIQTRNGGPLMCITLGGGGGGAAPGGAAVGGAAAGRDDVELLSRNPIYVPADVTFDGETFRQTGFRLKGNSSLVNSWRSGTEKLPFRLNFDAMEDQFPEARDQTFFGFPNLAFSNHALDSSYLRAKVVTDLFREAGLPVPRTAFVRVFLDRGAGTAYLGLYTMVEVPDRPMLDTFFQSDNGNLYKPNGTGGRWTQFIADDFPKRTNASDEDWTDIADAIGALNGPRGDRALWRYRLDARFDVSAFLRWLALNTMVGNNDAYGGLSAHNYYLYGSPRNRDRLFWIPWDHDLAMPTAGAGFGGGGGGGGATGGEIDLFHDRIAANWPLIRLLMDDPVYRAAYRAHVEDLLATVFEPSRVGATLQSEHARIARFVIGAEGEDPARTFAGTPIEFDATVFGPTGLAAFVENRAAAVRRALGTAR